MPCALTPLAGDYIRVIGAGMAYGHQRLGTAGRDAGPGLERLRLLRPRDRRPRGGTGGDVGAPDRALPGRRSRTTDAYWHERAVPELRAHLRLGRRAPGRDAAGRSSPTTGTRSGRGSRAAGRSISTRSAGRTRSSTTWPTCTSPSSTAPAPGEALGLIGGGDHELQEVERRPRGAGRDRRRRRPGLAERLCEPGVDRRRAGRGSRSRPFHRMRSRRVPRRARPPRPELRRPDARLVGRGARPRSWPSSPSASSTPVDGRRPRNARGALANEADAARRPAPGRRLADDPERLARSRRLLADARQIGHLTETHNYWIDRMAQASLRRFVVRVGRRLGASRRRSTQPEDVFFLHRDEVPELLRRRRAIAGRSSRTADATWHGSRRSSRRARSASRAEDGGGDRFDGVRLDLDRPRRAARDRRVGRASSAGPPG